MAMGFLGIAAGLILVALQENIVFFISPTEIADRQIEAGQRFRLGGLVEVGSVERPPGDTTIHFKITDLEVSVPVQFIGLLPDLFSEGEGVVAEGRLTAGGIFEADSVLAKHDENYMPKEVVESLKKSGRWQPEENSPKDEDS
jgi:cytochrome c-type biogenesis protein CcmE